MQKKSFKQVCGCTNCGNEAEMVVTCTLEDDQADTRNPRVVSEAEGKTKGQATCTQCGNEADIWLDM